MPETVQFDGGLNAGSPADKIAPNEVQACSNIDFRREDGGAGIRRGSVVSADVTGRVSPTALLEVARHYTDPAYVNSPTYVMAGSNLYRGTGSSFSVIQSGYTAGNPTGFAVYKQFSFIAKSSINRKDDGTTTFEWLSQVPGTKPTVTIQTLTPFTIASVWSVSEGTLAGNGIGTATATADEISFRVQFDGNMGAGANLNMNGANVIGDFGIDYLDIWFSEPKLVTRISRDYSIGDTTYNNYWHTELDVVEEFDALPEAIDLIDAQLNKGTSTITAVEFDDRQLAISRSRGAIRAPHQRMSLAKNQFNSWAVPRTKFELVGPSGTAGWTDIKAARVVVECLGPIEVLIRNWRLEGGETYPFNDPEVGYSWWESWARIDASNNILWESALSPASDRVKIQGGRAAVILPNVPTGTSHGFTHKLVYRGGGYLPAPYRVGTFAGTASGTFTDTRDDIKILIDNQQAVTNLRRVLPGNIATIESAYDRLFIGYDNKIIWTSPGAPDTIPIQSDRTVSHAADLIRKIIAWPPGFVIVNRDSVYEMTGSVFEGRGVDVVLQRTGSRHGSVPRKSCIKTEFGVLLVNYDGLYMYVPGQGIDQPIVWANQKLWPAFQGPGAADPAALDGSRIPAVNLGVITEAVAAYKDSTIYLGLPTGTSVTPNTLFVLDFVKQRVWHYTYPWNFSSIFWDSVDNKLMLGGDDGALYRVDIGVNDSIVSASQQGVAWSFKTRAWPVPSDTRLENISVEYRGGNNGLVKAIHDGTTTATAGTLTSTIRAWSTPSLGGTAINNIAFELSGTQSDNPASVYNLVWDALQEPVRVTFYRTEHTIPNPQGESMWDVLFSDIEVIGTGTVLGTAFVDNVAVLTNTIIKGAGDRLITQKSFPADTYGEVGYVIYNGQSSTQFKHWATRFSARPEPPRVNVWKDDVQSLEEQICDAVDVDVNPAGTVLGTVFVDNVAVSTGTFTGTNRQSYTHRLGDDLYGRTIYTIYTGTAFKHYKTWYHLRPEPDRWTSFITDRESIDERILDGFDSDIDPLGATVLATGMVDGTAISTATMTGSGRRSYTMSLAQETYGRTAWVQYSVSGGLKFKHYRTWFHVREEPDRWITYVTSRESGEEQIWDAVNCDIDCLNSTNTVLATTIVDNTAVSTSTYTGSARQSYVNALPNETYGRTAYVKYTAITITGTTTTTNGRFKHYNTWFDKRQEPDRLQNYVSGRQSGEEHFWEAIDCDIDPLGNTVLATAMIDGSATTTATLTGTERRSFAHAFPEDIYGRTGWVVYNVSGTGRFKHYNTWFHRTEEPDRLVTVQWGPKTFPSDSVIKTWIAELNPLGTATGIVYVDGTAVSTETFVGTRRQVFNAGLPNITVGDAVDVVYTNATKLKHYQTDMEIVPKPFYKKTWLITYRKIGGASQLDKARFYALDIEPESGTATITSTWEIDGTAFHTSTHTFTAREWRDRLIFPPGGRGAIFQQRMSSSQNFRVWHSGLDLIRTGRKGVVFAAIPGTPVEQS